VVTKQAGSPSILEMFVQGRDGYNLVLGGMLGAYLGLTISRNGLQSGTYFDLGFLLWLNCVFVVSINNAGDRFHRKEIKYALMFGLSAIFMGMISYFQASRVGVDNKILLTIFIVWGLVILFEVWTSWSDVMGTTGSRK
jgi:hypothetical protein